MFELTLQKFNLNLVEMKRILLPIDLSENSKHAVKYALNLYEKSECSFYFLHTYTPAVYTYDYQLSAGSFEVDTYNNELNTAKERVEEFMYDATKDYRNRNYKFHSLIECGVLTDVIKENVTKLDIDLIIMGTKGATSSNKLLFGTNTIQVINKRICPVIAVPEHYEIKKTKDILFPTDLHVNYKDKHLNVLKGIAQDNEAKIYVFHVLFRGLTSVLRKSKEALEHKLEDVNYEFVMTEDKDIPVAINDYKEENCVDLLMMINNKHLFFENLLFRPVISSIAMKLKVPLLVVSA